MTEPSISLSRDIPASAERIFSLLVRTTSHTEVDGSGMLRGALDDIVISKVGDVFGMKMHHPDMGDYVMDNHVVEFEAERRLVWEPVPHRSDGESGSDDGGPGNYRWGWQLEALEAEHTRVTEFFDCSRSPEWLRNATKDGEGWRSGIEDSLGNVERLVTG